MSAVVWPQDVCSAAFKFSKLWGGASTLHPGAIASLGKPCIQLSMVWTLTLTCGFAASRAACCTVSCQLSTRARLICYMKCVWDWNRLPFAPHVHLRLRCTCHLSGPLYDLMVLMLWLMCVFFTFHSVCPSSLRVSCSTKGNLSNISMFG